MNPIRYDNEIPVFTTRDIDDYGFPEIYGYEKYIVVESRELNLVTDYKMEQEREFKSIHRYSRLARFKSTLYQLLGERGQVAPQTYSIIQTYLKPTSQNKWNDTRKLLKHFKLKGYDKIPTILHKLGYGRSFDQIRGNKIDSIINDFKYLSDKFERTKEKYSRRYFPNIRYICFKLLELHGLKTNYPVPFIRTERKRKALEEIWQDLIQ